MPFEKLYDFDKIEKSDEGSENSTKPKRLRWCKCIVTALLCGSFLSLILVYIDFTGEADKSRSIQTHNTRMYTAGKDRTSDKSPYLYSSKVENKPNCVQMLCDFVCTNGTSAQIEMDIYTVAKINNPFCSRIEKLIIDNYLFPDSKLYNGFLGIYSDKVVSLTIKSSNIREVVGGAFGKGIFKAILLVDLQLTSLHSSFFWNISQHFDSVFIRQIQTPIKTVDIDFLLEVKSMIRAVSVVAGLTSIHNITGGSFRLNKLYEADFRHNNFGSSMENTDFNKASNLQWLHLSHSNLEYLPSHIFANIVSTLSYLDLSHNKLKTISRLIFGWNEIQRNLYIEIEDNQWLCSCDLQQDTRYLTMHFATPLLCSAPEAFQGKSLYDDIICVANTRSMATTAKSFGQTTESPLSVKPTRSSRPDELLECLTDLPNRHENTVHFLRGPRVGFNLLKSESCHVDVIVDSFESTYNAFVITWNSKGIRKDDEMKINYNEYGVGCYKKLSAVTRVKSLTCNTAYTFCLAFKEQLTVSPFNCKSIYVDHNLGNSEDSAWLTRDMKVPGLTIIIIGNVVFLFASFFISHALLKRKPALVKGYFNASQDKSVRPPIEAQKEQLDRFSPSTICSERRKSTYSAVSYNSCINANLYEEIPATENLHKTPDIGLATPPTISADINKRGTNNYYLTPSESLSQLSTRCSNDILPEVASSLPSPTKAQDKAEHAQIGKAYFLDSHM